MVTTTDDGDPDYVLGDHRSDGVSLPRRYVNVRGIPVRRAGIGGGPRLCVCEGSVDGH